MDNTLIKNNQIKNLIFNLEDIIPKLFSFKTDSDYAYAMDLFDHLLKQEIVNFRLDGYFLNQDAYILFFLSNVNQSDFYQNIINQTILINKVKPIDFDLPLATSKQSSKFRDFLKKNKINTLHTYELPSSLFLNVAILIKENQDTSGKSKYGSKKVYIDYHLFDSRDEANYYFHLLDLKEKGEIKNFELQPVFLLQESFKKNDITYPRIDYKADFEVYHCDGTTEVIDVKGLMTTDFKIKQKMFEYHYRDRTLKLLTYKKTYGGWITLDEYESQKNQRKLLAKSEKKDHQSKPKTKKFSSRRKKKKS